MSSQEIYSINAASKLTGYSLPTIRKRLPALKKAGAIQRGGVWEIPLSALHAVGLMSKVESGKVSSKGSEEEIATLRLQLAQAEARAQIAEALAVEREKALERMDRALLALEAKPPRKRWGLFS
jgi:DeoR/GlpR family transcriptional regulator of sugar metabolism